MGRFATLIAAKAVNAGNLPQTHELPEVSLSDVLLPKWASKSSPKKKPITPVPDMSRSITYSEVKKNKKGKLVMVNHKQKACTCHSSQPAVEDAVCVKNGGNKSEKGTANPTNDIAKIEMPKNDAAAKPDVNGKQGVATDRKPNDKEFTPEEDSKLKEMKSANKTWREIAQEMKRPQGPLKNRYKAINKDSAGDDNNAGGKGKTPARDKIDAGKQENDSKKLSRQQEKPSDKAPRKSEKQSKRTNHVVDRQKSKPPSVGSRSSSSEAKFTLEEWQTLQEDDLFTFDELKLLVRLIMKDGDTTWLRVASRFADRTGRRVHQDDIREKFEQIVNMNVR